MRIIQGAKAAMSTLFRRSLFEGGEASLAEIRDTAEGMTDFHVDLVCIERVDPGRAGLIRRFGRIVWESADDG